MGKKIIGYAMSVIGVLFLILSVFLGAVFIASVGIFYLGWFLFALTDNLPYFTSYVRIENVYDSVYSIIQLLFIIDYTGIMFGIFSLPSAILSCICVNTGLLVAGRSAKNN